MEKLSFEKIFTDYERPLYNFVLRMVRDAQTAEDLTQDIFIKIYQNLTGFLGNSSVSTWVYKIATNAYLDYIRSSGYKKNTLSEYIEEGENGKWDHGDHEKILAIDEQIIKSEMNICIQRFLDDLPEDYRTVIVLHDLQDLKNREVAKILDCSLETVKIRLHRARKKFRKILADNCEFYRDTNDILSCLKKEDQCQ
jgi:RNA polymerase sigma-70 factor (ECF subfamily)